MTQLCRLIFLSLLVTVSVIFCRSSLAHALIDPPLPAGPPWATPTAVNIRSLGTTAPETEGRLSFQDNLNCLKQTYRLNGADTPQSGCYMSTAFGSLDVNNDLIGFAGNDQTVVPLVPYGPHDVLLPWPGTSSMIAVSPAVTEGSYLSLYRDILGATIDQHNILGQVTAKQVTRAADMPLLDAGGRKLVANFNSLAFSDGGSWLVVESTSGSFQRINLASLTAKPFAPSYTNFGGGGYNESQVAISPDGDYVAIANSAAHSIRVYDLANCPGAVNENTVCPSHEYWPDFVAKNAGFQHPVHLRFLNDGVLSLIDVTNAGSTTYELSPTAGRFALLDYLALGDSYASGEGAFAYRTGTDTTTNGCHSSNRAYPLLLANDLFTKIGANSVACSGALIRDIVTSSDYPGQVTDGVAYSARPHNQVEQYLADYTPGYLPQTVFASHYQPAAITVSVGGNDIGFGDLVALCVAPHFNLHATQANDCIDTYEDRLELARIIDAQVIPLTTALKKLQAASPGSTIYVVGYPLIAVDTGSCALNVHLNAGELGMIIEATKQLNNAITRAANASGVSYVSIENALAGHRLCETKSNLVAVNGITAGNDAGFSLNVGPVSATINFLGQESFHPNAYGYQLIEQEILRQTHNLQLKLAAPIAKPAAADPGSKLLLQPKTGRVVRPKTPAAVTKTKSAKRGGSVAVRVPGKQHGLKPRSPFTINLSAGHTVNAIGVISSDADGTIAGTVTVPPNTLPGTYQIDASGTDQLGNPVTMIDVITIYTSDSDYDGDGIPNTSDSCPTVPNSGIDGDHDNIDDACDSLIGLPPQSSDGGITNSPPNSSPATQSAPATAPLAASDSKAIIITPPTNQPELQMAPDLLESSYIDASTLKVAYPRAQPSVLGAAAAVAQHMTSSRPQKGQETAQPRVYTPIKHLYWYWFVVLYVFGLIMLLLTKRAQRWLNSLWRRKRDSNPRYP